MARNCPKNTNNPRAKARETTDTTTTNNPQAKARETIATTTTPKLTKAQQICALEESMAEEERAEYLDARDMGQDFWSAGA